MRIEVLITRKGLDKLHNELNQLIKVERPRICKEIEETRPYGIVGDNPEFMQAINSQVRLEKQISDLTAVINRSKVFNPQIVPHDVVDFGATVELVDENGSKKVYTIVSIYESDLSNGFISIDCPLVQSMIGLVEDDEFEFNNRVYTITRISYDLEA